MPNVRQLVFLFGVFLAAALAAQPTVQNPGFEDAPLGDGAFSNSPPGWDVSDNGGYYNPTVQYFEDNPLAAPAGGVQAGFINAGTLCQDVGGVITGNREYSLTVAVGWRLDNPNPPVYAIELRAATSDTVKASDSPTLIQGEWVSSTASFIPDPDDPDLGDGLRVCLSRTGEGQGNFDNVVVSETSPLVEVPTSSPLSLSLLFLGLITAAFFVIRRSVG